MSDEQVVVPVTTPVEIPAVVEITPEEAQRQAEADFAAGYENEQPKDPADTPAKVEKPAETEAPVDTPAKVDTPVEAPAETPLEGLGLTVTEVKNLLAKAGKVDELQESITKAHTTASGRYGELQQALRDLQTKTTAGTPTKVSKEQLKKLGAAYPEIAEYLADDLSELTLQGQAPAANPFDSAALEAKFKQEMDASMLKLSRATEKKLLTMAHPDWNEVTKEEDYKLWRATLPLDLRTTLDTSWDSVELSGALTAYKSWKQTGKKLASDTTKKNDKRLASAVQPKGSAAPVAAAISDEDAFLNGYKNARRQA